MNKRTYILVFLLLLAGFTSELSAQKKPKKAKQEISVVSGQVVDSSGIPVAGALVTAMEGAYFARTDADGAFSVKSGAADYILIEAEGYEPKEVYLPDLAAGQAIALEASPYRSGSADRVELPFGTLTDRRVVGAVNDIDMDRYKDKLSDYGLDGVLQAEGFGVFGAKDVRGMGYTILIDGLVRDGSNSVASLSDMLNADEVERITVLKDAASRLLYGSYADKGIILIKTRRGEAHKRIMNFSYETSFGIPKAQPEYLRAADYMILYNEALRNDGGNPMYSYQDIENARAGVDPVKYPDQDYYSSEFLRGFKPQNRVSAEFIGGSRVAQYYLNAGFYNTKSIVSMGESDKQRTNRFNVRGNVDVNINKYIKVSLDAAAIFNSYHGPNWKNGNFWRLSTENPVNSYPFLIPVDRLDMEDEYTKTALEDAELQRSVIGGKYLVGGNNNNNPNYLRNPYGDLYLGGYANTMDRMAHINVGIDVDFSWLTEGLSFKTYFGTDNYNKYTTTQNNSYASYEPAFGDDGTIRIANIYGSNDFVGSQTMTDTGFYRRLGWNNALSYDRTFSGRHQLSAVLMSTMHHYKESGATHAEKSVNFGGRVNYAFADKYVAEYSGAYIGSTFLSRGNRWGYAQGGGLGWIVSEEEFLRGSRWLNYLKIKVSYANTKSDSGMSNYIDTDIYDPGANYNYGDGTGQNALMTLQRGNPAISWVQRHDVNVGMEFSLFRHALSGEVNYFNSLRFDEITRRTSQLPGVLGSSVFIPNENYNSRRPERYRSSDHLSPALRRFRARSGRRHDLVQAPICQLFGDRLSRAPELPQPGGPADRCDLGPASRRVLYAGGDRPDERRRRDRPSHLRNGAGRRHQVSRRQRRHAHRRRGLHRDRQYARPVRLRTQSHPHVAQFRTVRLHERPDGGDQRLSERRVLCGLRAQRQVSGTPDRPLGLRSQPRDRYARYGDLSASDGQLVGDDAQLRQDVDVLARPAELLLDSGCPALLPFGRQADEDAAPERRDDLCARHRHPAALAFAGSDDPERGQRVPVRMGTPRSETEILTAKSRSLL